MTNIVWHILLVLILGLLRSHVCARLWVCSRVKAAHAYVCMRVGAPVFAGAGPRTRARVCVCACVRGYTIFVKCPLRKFLISFASVLTTYNLMKVVNQIRAPFGMADQSDGIQLVKIGHLPRTDFELCILDLFNMLMCAIDMDMWNLHELDMLPRLDRESQQRYHGLWHLY